MGAGEPVESSSGRAATSISRAPAAEAVEPGPTPVVLPRYHVPRPRLTSLLARSRVATIIGGGGYGKSVLAAEYARELGVAVAIARLGCGDSDGLSLVVRLRQAFRRSGLSDAAATVGSDGVELSRVIDRLLDHLEAEHEPVIIVVDEVQHAEAAAAELVRFARELPGPHRMVLVGRALPAPARALALEPDVLELGPADLAFSADEAALLVDLIGGTGLSGAEAERLVAITGGWPAALVVAANRIARSPRESHALATVDGHPALLAGLLSDLLAQVDATTAAGIVQLAHLPSLPAHEADRVVGVDDLVERAVAAGFPFEIRPDGELELAGPLREALVTRTPLEGEIAVRAGAALAAHGDTIAAVHLLVGTGERDRAAVILAALPQTEASRLDFNDLNALVTAVGVSVDRHPRALLHLARACEAAAQGRLRRDVLDRARAAADGDATLIREIDAETARDLIRDGRVDEAAALAGRLLDDAEANELQTRVRALHVLGRTYAWRADPASLAAAEPLLEEAAELYLRLGYATGSAHARLALAYDVQTLGGRFDAAVESLQQALTLLPARSRLRGVVLCFHGEALIDLGRYQHAEASLAEADLLGRQLGDARTVAYVAWVRARVAARRGERERVIDLLAQAEASPGDWFDHHSGAEFLAEAAVLLDECGEVAGADVYLRRAEERHDEAPRYVDLARGALAARRGDPEAAERHLAAVALLPDLEIRERWRVTLLRSWAARRSGDEARAGALAHDAFEQAAATGHPELPFVREPRLASELAGVAAAAGSAVAAALTRNSVPLRVSVLGGLAVTRGGIPVELPPGQPAQLVALLAVRGGRAGVDEVIDVLWPGTDMSGGRKRLRNVLNRLRSAADEIVARDGDALALTDDAEIDAEAFEQDAAAALSAPADAGHARSALARYTGTLLPELLYEEWAAEPRERLTRRYLGLLDLLAGQAEAEGDTDEAIRLLEQGIAVDRLDESRYLWAARLLLAQNRRSRALAVLRAAASALRELDLQPSEAHRALVRSART